jgi:Putative zinc ribbon domain
MFGRERRLCQSCGMPLSKDIKGGGTEHDGRVSLEFCSHCYAGGKFTEPELRLEQMVLKVQGKLKEMHLPGIMAKLFTRGIPKLRRWTGTHLTL